MAVASQPTSFETYLADSIASKLSEQIAAELAGALAGLMVEVVALRRAIETNSVTPNVFGRKGAAEYLGVNVRTLDQWVRLGYVRSAKIGNVVRFKREWLDDAIRKAEVAVIPSGVDNDRLDRILREA